MPLDQLPTLGTAAEVEELEAYDRALLPAHRAFEHVAGLALKQINDGGEIHERHRVNASPALRKILDSAIPAAGPVAPHQFPGNANFKPAVCAAIVHHHTTPITVP
jgi:hypothetical protein